MPNMERQLEGGRNDDAAMVNPIPRMLDNIGTIIAFLDRYARFFGNILTIVEPL